MKDIISIQHPNNPNQSDQYKLMITMESLTKDIIEADADNLWLYCQLYENFLSLPKFDAKAFPKSGIIEFSHQTLEYLSVHQMYEECKGLEYYTNFLAQMVNSNKYPYLKSVDGRYCHISVLQKTIQVCKNGDVNFYYTTPEKEFLVRHLAGILWDMAAKPNDKIIRIWSSELWNYAVSLELVPIDPELQYSYQDIYDDMESLEHCIDKISDMTSGVSERTQHISQRLPFPIRFILKMKYLQQVFAKFENEVSSQSSNIYQRLDFVKSEYKYVQFDPYVIKNINAMYLIINPFNINIFIFIFICDT